jgi:hypothetical protein
MAAQALTVLGAPQRGMPFEPLTGSAESKAQFDPLNLEWIGSAIPKPAFLALPRNQAKALAMTRAFSTSGAVRS